MKEIDLDEFHYHELFDRLYCVIHIIDELIEQHPVCDETKHKNLVKMIEEGRDKLIEAYQFVGGLAFDIGQRKNEYSGMEKQ